MIYYYIKYYLYDISSIESLSSTIRRGKVVSLFHCKVCLTGASLSTDLQSVVLAHISQWWWFTLKVNTSPIRMADQATRRNNQSRMKAISIFLREQGVPGAGREGEAREEYWWRWR